MSKIIIIEHHKKAKKMKEVLQDKLFYHICEYLFFLDYTIDNIKTMLKRNIRVIDSHKIIILNPKRLSKAFYYYTPILENERSFSTELGKILCENKIFPLVTTYE